MLARPTRSIKSTLILSVVLIESKESTMSRKGMRSLLSFSKGSSSSKSIWPSPSGTGHSAPGRSFSHAAMKLSLAKAESMIAKWNPEASNIAKVTSLFYENGREARDFVSCVNELQKAMQTLVKVDPHEEKLIRGQKLMEIAMKRLEKEFYQILSMNRAHLDRESVSVGSSITSTRSASTLDDEDDGGSGDEIQIAGDCVSETEHVSAIAMADLRLIADCMMSSGYGKECIKIYKKIRKSIVDEGIYRLGVEKISSSQIQKMDWAVMELKIENWLNAVKIAMKTLFIGERILCDHVFATSDSVRESCFSEITKEGALILFGFPEFVAKSKRKSPKKVFSMLDMYTAIWQNRPEIESIFSFESTSAVLSLAVTSLIKLSDSIRALIADYESTLQKEVSKSLVPGGEVHHLTVQVMDHLSHLADYHNVLVNIVADFTPPATSFLPESYLKSSDSDKSPIPANSNRLAWLIFILLCKLDSKAEHYKDASVSYLFLANNVQHIVTTARTSNLKYLLGDDWLAKHEDKVKQFVANYELLAWGDVIQSLPENPTAELSLEEVTECLRRFKTALEQAYRKQSLCVITDSKLRNDITALTERKILAAYREFCNTHRAALLGEMDFGPMLGGQIYPRRFR